MMFTHVSDSNKTNTNTNTSSILSALNEEADKQANDSLKKGVTWNGDVNFSELANSLTESNYILLKFNKLLEVDQKAVQNTLETWYIMEGKLNEFFDGLIFFDGSISNETETNNLIVTIFRYLFYLRNIRGPGKRSRLLFYHLFKKLRQVFPQQAVSVVSLIPIFGCFKDLDELISMFEHDKEMTDALLNVYVKMIKKDVSILLGTNFDDLSHNQLKSEIIEINEKLKEMSTTQVVDFVKQLNGSVSFAGKWLKREGKSNSSHRVKLIHKLLWSNGKLYELEKSINEKLDEESEDYFYKMQKRKVLRESYNKKLNFSHMVLRKIGVALSQCLNIVEHNMTEATGRGWGEIQLKYIPSRATTIYRKALLNELLKSTEQRSCDADRIECAKNTVRAIMEGKLNGAQQDLEKLANIIWTNIDSRICYLSENEKNLINAQWVKLVEYVNQLINEYTEENTSSSDGIDPRAIIPVIDVSGSMNSANVMHKAIALGILCSTISTIPGVFITFSDTPNVIKFDPNDDIFSIFKKVRESNWGFTTNIDATYKLLLKLMEENNATTDYSLVFLTDGQFNNMVSYSKGGGYRQSYKSFDEFNPFYERMSQDFNAKGIGVPRSIFWNLNSSSPGFPSAGDTVGVQLVSGFSQTLAVQVLTGDFQVEIDPETGSVKVQVNPLEQFLNVLNDDLFDCVEEVITETFLI